MLRFSPLLLLLACSATRFAAAGETTTGRDDYLALAKEAYAGGLESVPASVERWRATYEPMHLWGYGPPGDPIWLSRLAGSLYAIEGDEAYAREAAKWLAAHHEFKSYYPRELQRARPEYHAGLPTLTDFFQLPYYCQAWLDIKDCPAVTQEQRARIEQSIAESADFVFYSPEWGPMNRAVLRAEGLLLASRALPEHPDAKKWLLMSRLIGDDSWNKWEEEDAQIYHAVWVTSLIRYADALGDDSLFEHVTLRYYFDYFTHLIAPTGMIPAFGDARWNEGWAAYVACLERGAAQYGRADLKWAAQRIVQSMLAAHERPLGIRLGIELVDAYRWADDSLPAEAPPARSEEVLEDLVGKKIVFRDGWSEDATFLLLNYRDEGPFARVPRDYLRTTIPVEEEKGHHGHSDENSIVLLTSGGSVLLHDAGYRDRIPSGKDGAFRADYFHNRLVARTGKREWEQPIFDFLRNSGAYRPVETEKIDFYRSEEVDVSRTRLIDRKTGYEADRIIAYLKRDDLFVVFDVVKILETDFYTFTNLWHAQQVVSEGPRHFVCVNDEVWNFGLDQQRALLVSLPQEGIRQTGTFPLRRHYQDETAIYQTASSHYHAGQVETFVTVLVPHDRGADVAPLNAGIRLLETDEGRDGVGVALTIGGDERFLCVKTDLLRELLTENVRPRYTWESGKVRYGPIVTDAYFTYARKSGDELRYAATHLIGLHFEGQPLFAARDNTFSLQPDDHSSSFGMPKWRAWEDVVDLGGE